MSSIHRGKNRKGPEVNNGVSGVQQQSSIPPMQNGVGGVSNPSFGLPHVSAQPQPTRHDMYTGNPIGTVTAPMYQQPPTGIANPGFMPQMMVQQQPQHMPQGYSVYPQQYYQPQQADYSQQARYAQAYDPSVSVGYPAQAQQSAPEQFMQPNMYAHPSTRMGVPRQPVQPQVVGSVPTSTAPPETQAQRQRKILKITNPNTGEDVSIHHNNNNATVVPEPAPKPQNDVPHVPKDNTTFVRDFHAHMKVVKEGASNNASRNPTPRVSECEQQQQPPVTVAPIAVQQQPDEQVSDAEQLKPESNDEKDRERSPSTVSLCSKDEENAVAPQTDKDSRPAEAAPSTEDVVPEKEDSPVKEEEEEEEKVVVVTEEEKENKEVEPVPVQVAETKVSEPKEKVEAEPVKHASPAPAVAPEESVKEESPAAKVEEAASAEPSTASAPSISTVEKTLQEEDEAEPEKSAEEKAAEEAEKRRQREAELDALMAEMEADPERCDTANMVYSRAFLHLSRDLQKEFKRTPCLKTDAELKTLGIDRASYTSREKTKTDFIPSWNKNKTSDNKPRPYAGRFSVDSSHGRGGGGRGGHAGRKTPGPRPSIERTIERTVPLHKAEAAWKPEKKLDSLPEEEAKRKIILRNVRSLMNKITPTSQAELTKEFLSYDVSSNPTTLSSVIDIIFDKAVEEPKFCPLYAELCRAQVNVELEKDNKCSVFRNGILARAQVTFQGSGTETAEREAKEAAIAEAESDPKKKLQLQINLLEFDAKCRRRKFGNISFIGELFKQNMLSGTIINVCHSQLCKTAGNMLADPEIKQFPAEVEEEISCAVKLQEAVGKTLESLPATIKGPQASGGKPQPRPDYVAQLDVLKAKSSNRIRFMILNLVELKRNGWRQRKAVDQGPKKLDQIHKEARQEEIENQQARDRYDRGQGFRGGSGGGGMQKKTVIGRGSMESRGGPRMGGDKDRRTKAALNSSFATSTAAPRQLSSLKVQDMGGLGKKTNWKGGAVGGGGESSAPTPSAWGRDGSASRKSSTVDERSRAMAAAAAIGSGGSLTAAQRSASQTSISSQASQEEPKEADTANDEKREEQEEVLVKGIVKAVQEIESGDIQLTEAATSFVSNPTKPYFNLITVRSLFNRFFFAVAEKLKQGPVLKHAGQLLAVALQSPELKPNRAEALQGCAELCELAVEVEMWEDTPIIWKKIAEVIIQSVLCEEKVYEGPRPQLDDFKEMFVIAAKDTRKDYELLTHVLLRMTEILHENGHEDSIPMMYEEVQFIKKLDNADKLVNALKAMKVKDKSLYTLLTQ